MRPLELRLRNFRSFFGDDHTFDFRDRHLVGVVGPIGAGKSTILDAIAYALYGRTHRINRSTKSLIHQRADGATVFLRFSVGDDIWEVVRSIRQKGQSQHALYRYPSDDPDAEPVEKVLQEGEVNARIEAMLGFDYDAFGRSVLLAQGQFAEFLTAPPRERDRVLRGLFGHDRIETMRDAAKQKVANQAHEIELLDVRLEAAGAAQERLQTQRAEYEILSARVSKLAAAEEEVVGLAATIQTAGERQRAFGERLDELNRLADRMPDAAASQAVTARSSEARDQRKTLAAEHEKVHAEVAEAEKVLRSEDHQARLATIEAASGLLVRLDAQQAAIEGAVAQHQAGEQRATKAEQERFEAQMRVAEVRPIAEAAEATVAEAKSKVEASEHALHEARHADMAASLRSGLSVGETCPVCAQEVPKIPPVDAAVAEDAEAAVASSRAAFDLADHASRKTSADLEAAAAKAEASAKRAAELAKDVEGLAVALATAGEQESVIVGELVERLGEGEPRELVKAAKVEVESAASNLESVRRRVDEARRALDAAITAEQDADRALGDLRTQVSTLAGRLDSTADIPEDDPRALAEALGALRAGWVAKTAELDEQKASTAAELAAAQAKHGELFAALEIDGDFSSVFASAKTQAEMLALRLAEDEKVISDAGDLVEERQALEDSATNFRRLQTDLTDAKFIRYLLDEERVLLAELGSEHFQRLSSGRYRFTEDGDFHLVDLTAADAVRRPDSLSGGETFLASLGLALGLAEMVGRTGGRLDAFFLDEGFGTLDPEHLDLAMEGIEALVANHPNRLVVVVSHVPEMRHRVEDLIELDRNPVTGDSIVLSGAGG